MSQELKIHHVGKVELIADGSVIKTYNQKVSGSAWKKVGTDIILLRGEGYKKIILKINPAHPNKDEMLHVAAVIKRHFPGLSVKTMVSL